jgi:hypothetical protein
LPVDGIKLLHYYTLYILPVEEVAFLPSLR